MESMDFNANSIPTMQAMQTMQQQMAQQMHQMQQQAMTMPPPASRPRAMSEANTTTMSGAMSNNMSMGTMNTMAGE